MQIIQAIITWLKAPTGRRQIWAYLFVCLFVFCLLFYSYFLLLSFFVFLFVLSFQYFFFHNAIIAFFNQIWNEILKNKFLVKDRRSNETLGNKSLPYNLLGTLIWTETLQYPLSIPNSCTWKPYPAGALHGFRYSNKVVLLSTSNKFDDGVIAIKG